MRKIWLMLAVGVLTAAVFTTMLILPDRWLLAQSTPSPTEEAQEEMPTEATPAASEDAKEDATDSSTAITDTITDTVETTHTMPITGIGALTETTSAEPLVAMAEMQDVDGNVVGTATFTEDLASGTVNLSVEISGLEVMTPGEHGIHVHQIGLCTPDFMAAGDHFNPEKAKHGLENPHGAHAGDLPNIKIDEDGNASYTAETHLFTLSDGPASLLAADGSALMIHAMPDDYMTDPSGKSGARIACGVIIGGEFTGIEPPTPPIPTGNATVLPAQRAVSPERIAQLQVTEGFTISVFARDVANVRMMAQDESGYIYVTRPAQGDVIALMDADGDGVADDAPITATAEMTEVHGIIITGNQVYLATPTTIYLGEVVGDGTFAGLEPIVDDLPDGGQHGRRTMAFGPDGMLYVSIGSACNECVDANRERATILKLQPDGSERTIFAEGLRNTIGFGWHPETGEMWGMDHGSDGHGNDVPHEELNLLEEGNNYGYPFCFNDKEVNEYISTRPPGMTKAEFCDQSVAPVLTYQAHSAPIGMDFYTGDAFPEEYQNNAFVALRGSWNRTPATGYKVVQVIFDDDGQPVDFEDFVTGWLIEDGMAHFGRVAGILELQDGSLLISEDTNGTIYRVAADTAAGE